MNYKERYREMLTDVMLGVKAMRGDGPIPHRITMGTGAYRRMRAVLEQHEEPGFPGQPGSIPRSLLVISGLPVAIDEGWPTNLWAVLDTEGKAVQAGVLDDLPVDS